MFLILHVLPPQAFLKSQHHQCLLNKSAHIEEYWWAMTANTLQWSTTICGASGQVGCGKAAEILALEINFSVLSCCSQQSEGGLSKGPKYFSLEGGLACCLLCCGAQTLSLELLKPPKSPTASPARDLQRSIFCSFKHSQDRLQQRMQEGIPKARFIFLPVWDKFSRKPSQPRTTR